MKKVLIITDLFHASPRIPGLCNYLNEFGWEPTLLVTPLGDNPEARKGPPNDFAKRFKVIEVPYKSLITTLRSIAGFQTNTTGARAEIEKRFGGNSWRKRFMKKMILWAGAIIAYPDELRAWRKPAIRAGDKLLHTEKFDAILTSSSPVTSHRIAHKLKKRHKLPWLADFRDLWTQNHYYLYPAIRKVFEIPLEIRTIGTADALTTVSDSLAHQLQSRYGSIPATVITNGFDPATVNYPPAPLTQKFTITYTGTIYRGKQLPNKLFAALHDLLADKLIIREDIEVRFYGASLDWLDEPIQSYNLGDIVKQYGFLPHSDALKKQRESQILLMFGWETGSELGVLLTKSFEYYAARRPILITGGTPKEQIKEIIDEAGAGRHAPDVPGIKAIILDYYHEFKKTGAVTYRGNPALLDRFSYREMARKFAEVLESIASKPRR